MPRMDMSRHLKNWQLTHINCWILSKFFVGSVIPRLQNCEHSLYSDWNCHSGKHWRWRLHAENSHVHQTETSSNVFSICVHSRRTKLCTINYSANAQICSRNHAESGRHFTTAYPELVAALLRVVGVTAGLAESSGSLLSGLWLTSPAGWQPRTGISSGTLCSVIEHGLRLPFYPAASQSVSSFWHAVYRTCWLFASGARFTKYLTSYHTIIVSLS